MDHYVWTALLLEIIGSELVRVSDLLLVLSEKVVDFLLLSQSVEVEQRHLRPD